MAVLALGVNPGLILAVALAVPVGISIWVARRRRERQPEPPPEPLRPTDERFEDPETRRTMRIWIDPEDGSRHALPEGRARR
jgi:hypothetical protein